jgi:hypothetical protein
MVREQRVSGCPTKKLGDEISSDIIVCELCAPARISVLHTQQAPRTLRLCAHQCFAHTAGSANSSPLHAPSILHTQQTPRILRLRVHKFLQVLNKSKEISPDPPRSSSHTLCQRRPQDWAWKNNPHQSHRQDGDLLQ